MSEPITWAVMADGTFIKIMVNTGQDRELIHLRTDDFEHSSHLTYEMVTGKRPGDAGDADNTAKRDYYELLSGFLKQQYEKKAFDRLILAAPETVLGTLKDTLPETVNKVVVGELTDDLLPKSADVIEKILGDMIMNGKEV